MRNLIADFKPNMSNYPWDWVNHLAARVENCSRDEAYEVLTKILSRFDEEHGNRLQARKLRASAVLSHVLRGANRGGAPSEPILDIYMAALNAIVRKRKWESVERLLYDVTDRMMDYVEHGQQSKVDRLIRVIQTELHSDPRSARTLREHAYDAGLSEHHLSRRFTQVVGVPFGRYRKRLRMEIASKLLRETDFKVAVIAQRVGMRDVSRFIRDFRLEMGQTPGVYRERLGNG